ncbi:MAG TPA: MaoC/PaaZ C-terminal domain-containing protein [Streptomyces sp.]|nr:MaoC/PaaZ C-terminal domain-containing protein [Streptomyces sp.]
MDSPAARTVLSGAPALPPLLARGAVLSPFKRPRPDADFPRTRLVLPALRADPRRLASYARVCGFTGDDDALPLTYPHVLGFPLAMRLMSGRAFPLPLLGLVHTSVTVTRRARLPAQDAYELTVGIEGLAPHRRGTQATVLTEVRASGEVVWESRSTYLARHGTPAPAPGAAGEDPRPLPPADAWHLAPGLGRRYGAASGDRNLIHLHPLTARLFGFPRPIAHGMWTAARCLAEHGTPDAVTARADFRAPVPLPGTVAYGAADGRFTLTGRDGDGRTRLHVTGTVSPLRGA